MVTRIFLGPRSSRMKHRCVGHRSPGPFLALAGELWTVDRAARELDEPKSSIWTFVETRPQSPCFDSCSKIHLDDASSGCLVSTTVSGGSNRRRSEPGIRAVQLLRQLPRKELPIGAICGPIRSPSRILPDLSSACLVIRRASYTKNLYTELPFVRRL